MWQDKVNSLLLGLSAILLMMNVRRLYRDKAVRGVSIWPVVLYDLWGLWDVYYFPSLHQWFSMCASLVAVSVNTVWLFLAIYYGKPKPQCICYLPRKEDCEACGYPEGCFFKNVAEESGP